MALIRLEEANEKIPVKAGKNWRQQIINASGNYIRRQIARALPDVFEDYKMKLNAGTPFEETTNNLKRQDDILKIVNRFKEHVLRGRELNGEPRNFNF